MKVLFGIKNQKEDAEQALEDASATSEDAGADVDSE